MYRLPTNTRLVNISTIQSIKDYADFIEPKPNAIWLPADIAGSEVARNSFGLSVFQKWAMQNEIALLYPVNMLYCIMAYVPPDVNLELYPVGFPCKHNADNRETSIIYFRHDP